jgi:hypothetical protein
MEYQIISGYAPYSETTVEHQWNKTLLEFSWLKLGRHFTRATFYTYPILLNCSRLLAHPQFRPRPIQLFSSLSHPMPFLKFHRLRICGLRSLIKPNRFLIGSAAAYVAAQPKLGRIIVTICNACPNFKMRLARNLVWRDTIRSVLGRSVETSRGAVVSIMASFSTNGISGRAMSCADRASPGPQPAT